MSKIEQLQEQADFLKIKLDTIDNRKSEINIEIDKLSIELNELANNRRGVYSRHASIKSELDILILESKSPVYHQYNNGKSDRIIGVDDKYIRIKYDGDAECRATLYNRKNGWIKRKRSGQDAIDAQKALEIWNEHLKNAGDL